MAIPKSFIQDVLSRTDIVELIQQRVSIKKKGANYMGRCPFHDEKSPSFSVSNEKQFYYCFGCGAHGDAIAFLVAYDRMEFRDAIDYLANQIGIEIPPDEDGHKTKNTAQYAPLYELMIIVTRFYQQQLRNAPTAIDYLKSRAVSGQIAKDFLLGFAPEGWDHLSKHCQQPNATQQLLTTGMLTSKDNGRPYDRFRHRIIFPIRNIKGQIIAFGGRSLGDEQPKYLNSPETPLFHKGDELYGLYEARQFNRELKRIVITEGYMDVIALSQHNIRYAVATLGTATNPKHLQKILRFTKEVIFCFDGDRAGKAAAWKALTISLPVLRDGIEIRFLFLPDQEDPDSLVHKIGQQAFEQQLSRAPTLTEVFFNHLQQQFDLSSVGGKAQFAQQANQYLRTMPHGIYYQLMMQRLADMVDLKIAEIEQLLAEQPSYQRPSANITAQPVDTSHSLAPTEFAIAMLLHHPELVALVEPNHQITAINHPQRQLLAKIIEMLKKNTGLPLGHLMAQLDSAQEKAWAAQLATRDLHISQEHLKEEFIIVFQRITERNRQQQVNQLIQKAKQQALSHAEKQLLQSLLNANQNN